MSKKKHLQRIVPAIADAVLSLLYCTAQHVVNALTPHSGYVVHEAIAYGDLPRQKLDVYLPDQPDPGRPVVVFFYGGRWEEGSRTAYRFVAQALTSLGYAVMVPDYRLYPQARFPIFVRDGALAVKWAHDHAAGYGGNAGNLFLMGHSAGAYIAAMLAVNPEYLQAVGGSRNWLAGMIGMSGPYDFRPEEAEDLNDIFGSRDQHPETQPVHFADGNSPPLLLMQGLRDRTVDPGSTRSLAEKVAAAGGEARSAYYPRVAHITMVGTLANPLRFISRTRRDIRAFIDQYASQPAATAEAPAESNEATLLDTQPAQPQDPNMDS